MSDDKKAEVLDSGVTLGEEEKEKDVENAEGEEEEEDQGSMDGKKWGIFAAASCCGILTLSLIFGFISMVIVAMFFWDYTFWDMPWWWRYGHQSLLAEAASSGSWSAVEEAVQDGYGLGPHGVVIIGNKDGVQVRAQKGWKIGFDEAHTLEAVGSFVNVATAYAAMAKNEISPDLPLTEVVSAWPADDKNTIYTMAAFTSGFDDAGQDAGCASLWLDGSGLTWDACMELAASDVISSEAGWYFYPGLREHMYVGGLVQTKLGEPRTHEGWEATMKKYVLDPAGIDTSVEGEANAAGYLSDCPDWMYSCGSFYWGGPTGYGATDPSQYANLFPNFNYNFRMSPSALAKVQHAIMFDNLLGDLTAKFFEDATLLAYDYATTDTEASDWLGWPYSPQYAGYWHYGQGAWIECDAAADHYWNGDQTISPAKAEELCRVNYDEVVFDDGTSGNSTSSNSTASNSTTAGLRKLQSTVDATKNQPVPAIHGYYGWFDTYIWFDFTNGIYGLYGTNYIVDQKHDCYIGFAISFFVALLVWIPIGKNIVGVLKAMEV